MLYLHHGWGGGHWTAFHDELSAGHLLLAPDLPGFTCSPRPPWLEEIGDYVLFVMDFMEQQGHTCFTLIGESLGGWIAAEFAVHHSDRLSQLVLMAPLGLQLAVPYADFLTMTAAEQQQLLFHDPAIGAKYFSEPTSEDEVIERWENSTSFARVAWTPSYASRKLAERLYRVSVPTLLLWGDDDRSVPGEYPEAWRAALPNVQLERVARCGHLLSLERPHPAARRVLVFTDGEPTLADV
jgi:pimeloyl-ACP methyl ester carboxylesterase